MFLAQARAGASHFGGIEQRIGGMIARQGWRGGIAGRRRRHLMGGMIDGRLGVLMVIVALGFDWLGLGRRRSGRRMIVVLIVRAMIHLLGQRRSGLRQDSSKQQGPHAAPPWCRTVTTRNIPACMCISMWQ